MDLYKILYEYESPEVQVEEVLTESGESKKKYKIKGVFSTIAEKNRNGRIYPRHLWESQVQKYQEVLKSGSINRLMEWEHPPRNTVDPMQAIAAIDKLYIEGNKVMGEATILDNEKGNQLKSLIDNGIKISVSSRGTGKVGSGGIVENFNLITYDCVSAPSDKNASMTGICESEESYLLTESGEFKQITAEELAKYEASKNVDSGESIVESLKEAFNKVSLKEDLNPIALQIDKVNREIKNLLKTIKSNKELSSFTGNIRKIEKLSSDFISEVETLEKELY